MFADTGGEWPETYEYLETFRAYLASHCVPLHVVRAQKPLYDHCLDRRLIPTRRFRWCTDYAKIRPIRTFARKVLGLPVTMLIGFDAGELGRTNRVGHLPVGISHRYPPQEAGLNRKACAEIVAAHGLPVPRKSGCTFCPFAAPARFIELHDGHPELWAQAVELEAHASAGRVERGKPPIYLHRNEPLPTLLERRGQILARLPQCRVLPGKGGRQRAESLTLALGMDAED